MGPAGASLASMMLLLAVAVGVAAVASPVPTDLCATSVQTFEDDRPVLFTLSEERVIWYKYQLKSDAWSTWRPAGDDRKMRSGPSAVRFQNGTIQVFALGYNDSKYYASTMKYNTSFHRFSNWVAISNTTFSSTPVAIVNPSGGVNVFGVSNDTGTVWYTESTSLSSGRLDFSAFADLGKYATSRPAVVYDPEGLLHVFVRGKDRALWHLSQSGQSGTPVLGSWKSLGGVLSSSPALPTTLNGVGMVDLYGRAADKAVWHRNQAATQTILPARPNGTDSDLDLNWVPWTTLGGVLASAPAVAADDAGLVHVFVRGVDSGIYVKSQSATPTGGADYGKWNSLGGMFTTTPTVMVRADGSVEVFTRGVDKAVWHARQIGVNGSVPVFSRWQSLGGHTLKYAC